MINLKNMVNDLMSTRDGQKKLDEILDTMDMYLEEVHVKAPELYHKMKTQLYICVYGYHFDKSMLECAYESMVNDNNSAAPRYSIEECEQMGRRLGVRFTDYNVYDYAYTVNMFYSDYCQVLGDDKTIYAKMAQKFLDDPDAPDHGATKALRYYLAVHPDM